jgi:arylsulfate sulfotransferase
LLEGFKLKIMRNLLVVFVAFAGLSFSAPLAVHLRATLPSPQPVRMSIGLSPRTENVSKGMYVFRYSVSVNGGPFRIVRDFSQDRDFAWGPELFEHSATIRVTVRNNGTKETANDDARYQIVSRAAGSGSLVSPSAHPLVALFSEPPCPEGSQFRVAFRPEGEDAMMHTSMQACRGSISNNVWVAGMRSDSTYQLRSEVSTGGKVKEGRWLPFHTGLLDGELAPAKVIVPRASESLVSEPILIHSTASLGAPKRAFATDLAGRVIWYMRSPASLTRVIPGGRFLVLADGINSVNITRDEQLIREIDLAGNIVRETNVGRVAEQLESRGIHSDCRIGGKECLSGFHHEAIRLPNGHTLVNAGFERMMPAGTQGSKEAVDILGDLIIDLDEDFQVAGAWNSFEHLDIKRVSVFNDKCHTGGGGCPAVLLAPEANGWLHSNSLNYIASSGDLLISVPEQDWIIKIDWKNGKGSGKVLWRLGKDGDFKAETKDPNPWFSYAHDVGFEPAGSNMLTVLDYAEARHAKDPKVESRTQVWKLDEEKHIATLVYNADLGANSICCGSSQILKNGSTSSVVGWSDLASPRGRTVETDKDGKIVYAIEIEGAIVYRSYRVEDMYSAPVK